MTKSASYRYVAIATSQPNSCMQGVLQTLVRLSSISDTTNSNISFFFFVLFFAMHAGRSYVYIGEIIIRDHRVSLRGL